MRNGIYRGADEKISLSAVSKTQESPATDMAAAPSAPECHANPAGINVSGILLALMQRPKGACSRLCNAEKVRPRT